MVEKHLSSALQLGNNCSDEDVSSTILALITFAIHNSEPQKSLSDIHHLITNLRAEAYLEPLHVLPLLLLSNEPEAREIISVLAECSSAKEVVMAVQEAAERLESSLQSDDDDDDEKCEGSENVHSASCNPLPKDLEAISPLAQLILLIDIYASAIPRIKLRRKSASDTIKPLFYELGTLIGYASSKASRSQGLAILTSISTLARNAGEWAKDASADSQDEVNSSKAILKSLLDRSLLACEHFIQSNIAQRTLEECFPRLAHRSNLGADWQEGAETMAHLLETFQNLGPYTGAITDSASSSDLILCAYQLPEEIDSQKVLSRLLPVIITSLQTNTFLDESLAVLIRVLHSRLSINGDNHLSHDISVPLCSILPSIASAHPDSVIRHQAFRILSLLLSSSDAQFRFQHLVELTRDSEFPQMRVASVGLVKESLLNALAQPKDNNPFLGPMFLRIFGPILFRPDPPDLFMPTLALKDFQETSEPGRLVECLSLYYVLLYRDVHNLTGIRDKDVIKSVDSNLLAPLRRNLNVWMDGASENVHDIIPIVSLKISLERVEAALTSQVP